MTQHDGPPDLAVAKRKILAAIDELRPEAIALLQRMISVPSPNPPGNETAMADFNQAWFRERGMQVTRIEPFPNRPSLVTRRVGRLKGKKTLLLDSHLDTIAFSDPAGWDHPMLGGEIHDGMIWGVGAKNMKSGMAAAMFLNRLLDHTGIELAGDLLFCQAADEMRGGFKGLQQVVERNLLQADYGIYTETGIPTRIEVGHRGRAVVTITVKGRTGHISEPAAKPAINAIVKMMKVIDSIGRLQFSRWEPHPLFKGKPEIVVNIIEGGHSENMQPDRCKIVCDCRTLPPQTTQTVIEDIERMLASIKRDDPEFDAEVALVHDAPYSFIPGDSPIVEEVQRAVVEVTGAPVPVLVSPATSDSRWLTLNAKIPTCKFSFTTVGSGPNERIKIEDYINMIRVYAVVTLNMLYRV